MDILMSVSLNSRIRESDMKHFYRDCVSISPNSQIKVNKLHHFMEIDGSKVHFLTEDEYEQWCKGKDYIYHGVPYHSGYPIKEEATSEFKLVNKKLEGLSPDVTFIDEFVTKEEE